MSIPIWKILILLYLHISFVLELDVGDLDGIGLEDVAVSALILVLESTFVFFLFAILVFVGSLVLFPE